jgi:hypothetical protein
MSLQHKELSHDEAIQRILARDKHVKAAYERERAAA